MCGVARFPLGTKLLPQPYTDKFHERVVTSKAFPRRCSALEVCKAWRDALQPCGQLWEAVVLTSTEDEDPWQLCEPASELEISEGFFASPRPWFRVHGQQLRQLHIGGSSPADVSRHSHDGR